MINKFAEGKEPDADDKGMKPLMVHANRHPFGALVKHVDDREGDGPHMVHAVHADGTYDTHPLHGEGKSKTAVPHENLTLLSESEYKKIGEKKDMDTVKLAEIEKAAADDKAALVAALSKNKKLMENARNEKISAFAEKYKEYGLTAALKPLYEAVAKQDVSAPVKLAEGNEKPFLEAFQSFAEELIKFKKVVTGEVIPANNDGEPKSDAIKLAELPVKAYAETNHMKITGTERAVKAREYSEKNNVPYKQALLAVAALEKENK